MAGPVDRVVATPQRGVATGQVIDSLRHPVVRRVADVLRSRSARPKVFVIDDGENIQQALRCGVRLDSLYVTEDVERAALPILTAIPYSVPRHVLSSGVVKTLFGVEKAARTFALARRPRQPTLRDLFARPGDIVVLDGVRLVGNIGAITRTACALGAAGLVLVDSGLTTTLDRRLVRASRGLVFAIPVVLARRRELTEHVRRGKLAVATLTADAPDPITAIAAVPERLALVLGGERRGVSNEIDAVTTHRYAIPMTGDVESLNVSVAAGIALYEHRRAGARPSESASTVHLRQ